MTTDGSRHRLILGDLVLSEGSPVTRPFTIKTLGDDADFGNPEPIDVTIPSQMLDGSDVRTTGHGNREVFLRVQVTAPDGVALAQAEAALLGELGRRNTLAWTPPAPASPTTVFQVLTSHLESAFNDMDELRTVRTYGIRLICKPSGRSVDEVVTPALASGATPVTVVVDECDSAAGWASQGAATVVDGAVSASFDSHPNTSMGAAEPYHRANTWITRTSAAVDMSATPYLVLDLRAALVWGVPSGGPTLWEPEVAADGVRLQRVSASPSPITGFTRFTYLCSDPSITTVRIDAVIGARWVYAVGGTVALQVAQVTRTNQAPTAGTGRQSMRVVDVQGTARSEGSLSIAGTTSLGEVLVYTSPQLATGNYRPDVMRWAQLTPTADPNTASGGIVSSPALFYIPARLLPPGGYAVMAQLQASSAYSPTVDVTAKTRFGTVAPALEPPVTIRKKLDVREGRGIYALGTMMLPPVSVPDASGSLVQISVGTSGGGAVILGELWLFHMGDDAALTWVDCGTGTPSAGGPASRLWIDAPTLESPNPTVLMGSQADRTDARHPGAALLSLGVHKFPAGEVGAFVVTSNVTLPAEIEFRHTPNWHTNAAS